MNDNGHLGAVLFVLGILCFAIEVVSDEAKTSEVQANSAPADTTVHIQIEELTGCLDAEAIRRSLEVVLRPYEDASLLSLAVVEAPAVGGSAVTLRVMMSATGEIVLERSFTLNEADCARAHQALQLVLEQFLSGFPIEEWIAENRRTTTRPPPPPEIQTREVVVGRYALVAQWLVSLGTMVRFPSPSGAVEIGTGPDVGTETHGFVGEAAVRVCYPKVLENGRYLETFALMGMGWRGLIGKRFQIRVLLRTGSLHVGGHGFDRNMSSWRLWIEAQVALAWWIGRSSLGLELGGAPLQYSVSISDGEQHPLAFLHAGLRWSIPVFFFSKNNEE